MTFGSTVRKLRRSKSMSIAEFGRLVGINPSYLAPIERDVFPPPAEEKVIRIARALDFDPDRLLALAGRVPAELQKIIRRNPSEIGALLRATRGLSPHEVQRLAGQLATGKRRSNGRSRSKTMS